MAARAWFREPLLHFALAGLVLFGLFRAVAPTPASTIVVSRDTVARLRTMQERRLGRAPDAAELELAIHAWADAEMLYREAQTLGLDRGDPIVRRRLMQKMQFLFEEAEAPAEPSDAELEQWIAEHHDRFEQAPRVSITHVFVASSSWETPEAKLGELEQSLLEGADPITLGEAFVMGQELGSKTAAELDRTFGGEFGQELFSLLARAETEKDLAGAWHRLRSIYGWHLVHVDEQLPGRLSTLAEVRGQAREGLLQERRAAAREQALAELRERYELILEEEA
jgi:hypothetical protein